MLEALSHELKDIRVSDIYADETLHWLVYDFFHEEMEGIDPPKAQDILLMIFSDPDLFRKFLLFYRSNWVDIKDNERSIFFFQSMLYLREIHGNYINHILNVTLDKVYDRMKTVHICEADGVQWDALERSIQNNIPVNNRWEIIYTLDDIPWWYRVFSFESRVHEVNYNGEVVRENLRNKAERCNVRSKILRYEKFLDLFYAYEIPDTKDQIVMREIMKEFERVYNMKWSEVLKDKKEEALFALKLRFYVHTQVSIYKKAFRVLQSEDTSSKENIALVWWIDVWD